MKKKASICGALVLACAVAAAKPHRPRKSSLPQENPSNISFALVGGTIYPSPFAKPIKGGVILISGGKIAAVGRGNIRIPRGVGRLDCHGMYITAGFQNSHVHFTEQQWNDAAQLPADVLAKQLREMLTRYGFTTVVDTGSYLPNTAAIRSRIESGEVPGPRILTSGSPLYPPNGIPFYLKGELPPEILKQLPQPRTAAEAVKEVDARIAGGADIIKLFTGSWAARGHVVVMPPDVADAAAKEAHAHGKLVFAHPSNVPGFLVALHAHVDVLAHTVEDTNGWNPSFLQQMKAQNMSLIPTLTLFMHDSNIAEILSEVTGYSTVGGQILFGTDVGFLQDYDTSNEYKLMQRAGLSFSQILASLTTAPAARFGQSERRGEIKPGMDADLVVLSADPQQNITALANVNYTFRNGQVVYSIADRQ